MRLMTAVVASLALAGPALAHDPLAQHRANELWAEQQMARQRALALETQLGALEAQVRTQEALRGLDEQRRALRLATPYEAPPQHSAAAAGDFAQIPDDRLAASNARVRAAARDDR